jgi:hypothetical protein
VPLAGQLVPTEAFGLGRRQHDERITVGHQPTQQALCHRLVRHQRRRTPAYLPILPRTGVPSVGDAAAGTSPVTSPLGNQSYPQRVGTAQPLRRRPPCPRHRTLASPQGQQGVSDEPSRTLVHLLSSGAFACIVNRSAQYTKTAVQSLITARWQQGANPRPTHCDDRLQVSDLPEFQDRRKQEIPGASTGRALATAYNRPLAARTSRAFFAHSTNSPNRGRSAEERTPSTLSSVPSTSTSSRASAIRSRPAAVTARPSRPAHSTSPRNCATIVDASACWRSSPHDFPNHGTVYAYYAAWRDEGLSLSSTTTWPAWPA